MCLSWWLYMVPNLFLRVPVAFALPLAQVSGEFDGIVEEIRVSLESLRHSAFFTGR